MSSTHKEGRESSRHPLKEYTEEAHNHPTYAGTKRLFSNRESRPSDSLEDYGENNPYNHHEEETHSGKRHRPSDWPLTSSVEHARTLQRLNGTSPSQSRPSTSQVRPSKFVEGSMNDRVSQMPPTPYLVVEEARERFEREERISARKFAGNRRFTQHPNGSVAGSSSNQSDVSRHSSIFRFGKSIAASFNPTNWKLFGGQKEEEESAQHKTLRERQEKAEKMYKELKKSGHFRDSNIPPVFTVTDDKIERENVLATPVKHDSGVALRQSGEMSREEKRMGRVFLEPPRMSEDTPMSNAESTTASARKSSFHFKRPSLSNIRKGFGSDSGSAAVADDSNHQPRRMPSRKDLQKQQKLVKRVSDLESKLEAARRHLNEALGAPLPPARVSSKSTPTSHVRGGRPRFVPGALSTLPSERLLSGYVSSDMDVDDNEAISHIGRAVTTADHSKEIMAGAKGDSYELEGDVPKVKKNKPLPKKPEPSPSDRVMESVESDEVEDHDMTIVPGDTAEQDDEVADSDSDSSLTNSKSESEYQHQSTKAGSESEDEYSITSDDDEAPKPTKSQAKTSTQQSSPAKSTLTPRSKKRKSTFEREGDRSGTYRPPPKSESSTTTSIPAKKSKTTLNTTSARPRKLQKTTTLLTPPNVAMSAQKPLAKGTPVRKPAVAPTVGSAMPRPSIAGGNGGEAVMQLACVKCRKGHVVCDKQMPCGRCVRLGVDCVARHPGDGLNSASPHSKPDGSSASSQLSKSQIPRHAGSGGFDRQSASPPPTREAVSFPGLAYAKPNKADAGSQMEGKGDEQQVEPMYSAVPSAEGSVPPMPTLPKSVRLRSGEVVDVPAAASVAKPSPVVGEFTVPAAGLGKGYGLASGGGSAGKLTKARPAEKKAMGERDSSFEWGEDVF